MYLNSQQQLNSRIIKNKFHVDELVYFQLTHLFNGYLVDRCNYDIFEN